MLSLIQNACCARPPDKDAQDPTGPSKPSSVQLLGAEDDGGSNGFTDFGQSKNAVAGNLKVRQGDAAAEGRVGSGPGPLPAGMDVIFIGNNCREKTGKIVKWSAEAASVQVTTTENGNAKTFWVALDKPGDVVCLKTWNSEIRKNIDPVRGVDGKGLEIQGICKNTSGEGDDMRVSIMNPETGKAIWIDAGKWTKMMASSGKAGGDSAAAKADLPKEGDEVIIMDHGKNMGKKGILDKIQADGDDMRFRVKLDGKNVFAQTVCKAQYWTD